MSPFKFVSLFLGRLAICTMWYVAWSNCIGIISAIWICFWKYGSKGISVGKYAAICICFRKFADKYIRIRRLAALDSSFWRIVIHVKFSRFKQLFSPQQIRTQRSFLSFWYKSEKILAWECDKWHFDFITM